MNSQKEFFTNTIIIFLGRFCTQFISFIMLPIYTIYLSTSDYGTVDLIQTYISLFVPIIALRLESAVFRFLIDARNNEKNKSKIITNTLFLLLIQIFLFSLIYVIINIFVDIKYCWVIILNIVFVTLSNVLLQLSRGLGDNVGYSIASVITGISTIILNVVALIFLKTGITGVLFASGISNLVCCIAIFFRNKIYKYIKFKEINKKQIRELLKYSLPMIPDGLSWWIVNVSDRTIISAVISTSANGIYAVSNKFSNVISNIFLVINMSWQESASLHINDDDRDEFFSNATNNILKMAVALCLGVMVCIPLAFNLVIGKNYHEALLYIPILILSNIFNVLSSIFGGIYISKKLTSSVARTTVLAALINLIINLVLIRWMGLFAAAVSTLVSYLVVFLYRYIDSKKFVKIKFDTMIIWQSIVMFIVSVILFYLNNVIGNVINFIIVIFFVFITNKSNIKNLFKFIKNRLKKA